MARVLMFLCSKLGDLVKNEQVRAREMVVAVSDS